MDKDQFAKSYIDAIAHCRDMNMRFIEIGEGWAEMALPYDPRLIGDPRTGVIHGGALTALMDSCCGAAVLCHPAGGGGTATIGLRIDHLRGAAPGQEITVKATCYHATRSVAFVRALAYDDDRETPLATATGTFTVEPAK
ncbi:PaaI family thioesterase [Chachezhania sediminis]|uniref:PaaI family thioesterase n=1 Tax=Chachezhania sediminis TaxID=2599291 RepID=UPI00131B1661|nr:PaaI family thioesterase [Chachezhania sediminis]